jgi:hypothetical protein
MPEPPVSSWPVQLTVKLGGLMAGSAITLLVGAPESTVFTSGAVARELWSGKLASKNTVA